MDEKFIPLSVPNIKGNELKYVTEALETEWVSTAGEDIKRFEEEFARYLGVTAACAVQSGTAGLHLCLRHYGIGPGDIVLVPTLTFIATINPVLYQNAEPLFFDCDEHLGIDVAQIAKYLETECSFDGKRTVEKASGKQVKAIIPVHVFGDYANLDALIPLAEKYALTVIEDATEALGTRIAEGRYQGKYAGTIGHAAVFSFNGNKIMTTGGGGMIVSNDVQALEHMRYLSQQAKDDAVYFINNEIGYNYRMTNLQAALGRGQLERLDDFIAIKRRHYALYAELIGKTVYSLLKFRSAGWANCWFYSLLTGTEDASVRDALIRHFSAHKIQTRPVWRLNHQQKPFEKFRHMPCDNASRYYAQIVNLPCSTNLSPADVERVCSVLAAFGEG